MIADYEDASAEEEYRTLLTGPRMYGLTQHHKHLPEMSKVCGLQKLPVFCPVVAPFYSGMEVTVQLFAEDIKGGIEEIKKVYADYYKEGFVRYAAGGDENGFLSAAAFSGRDYMQVGVYGNDERIILVSRLDNLGKGASGAAIQNMNLVMGVPAGKGLIV